MQNLHFFVLGMYGSIMFIHIVLQSLEAQPLVFALIVFTVNKLDYCISEFVSKIGSSKTFKWTNICDNKFIVHIHYLQVVALLAYQHQWTQAIHNNENEYGWMPATT